MVRVISCLLPRKGVAVRDPSGLKSSFEPMCPLLGSSVSERIRVHPSGRHTLKAVVSDGRSCAQSVIDVACLQDLALFGRMAPYTGQAIGLQLKPYR